MRAQCGRVRRRCGHILTPRRPYPTPARRFGDKQSDDPVMFTAIYVPYLLMPVLVTARLWPFAETNPFSHPLPEPLGSVLYSAILLVFTIFASYVIKWFVLCEPGMLGPLLPLLRSAAELPGGSKCPSA